MIPSITIFARHAVGCKYQGDETARRCDCRKHLRWSVGGRQYYFVGWVTGNRHHGLIRKSARQP
jgi:hypothetical protein